MLGRSINPGTKQAKTTPSMDNAKTPVFRLDRTATELDGEEKEVFVFFSDDKLLDRLLSFLSLEENKGKDRLVLVCQFCHSLFLKGLTPGSS